MAIGSERHSVRRRACAAEVTRDGLQRYGGHFSAQPRQSRGWAEKWRRRPESNPGERREVSAGRVSPRFDGV